MRQHIFRGISLLILSIFLLVPRVQAAAALSFRAALEQAYHHNPQMLEARQSIEVSKGGLITARSFKNPEAELEFGGFKKNEDGKRNVNLDSFEIRQPFDPLGVRFLQGKIASGQVKIQEESLKAVWMKVYLDIGQIYSQIILSKKQIELNRQNLESMRQFFSKVQLRYNSGQALKNDFQSAKIELLKAENNYLAVQKELKINKAQLNLILGYPMEQDLDITEELKEEELSMTFEELREIGFKNRPDIKIADLQAEQKRKNLLKEHLNRLPSYYVGFKRINESDRDDYAILVGISLPFWNANQGEVKKAKADKEIQEQRAKTTRDMASFEIYDAYLTAELHYQQFNIAKKSLEESDELLRLANLRYSEGNVDFFNYLDQIRTGTQSKVDYYRALFNLSRSISGLEVFIAQSLRQEEFLNEKF